MHERRLHLSVVWLLAGRHYQPVTKPDTFNSSVPARQSCYLYNIDRLYRCLHDALLKRQENMGQDYTLLENWASVLFPGLFRRERQCRHSWLLLCSFLVSNLSAAVRHCKPSTTTNVYKGGGVVGEKWLCLRTHFPRLWKGLSKGHLWQAGQTVD